MASAMPQSRKSDPGPAENQCSQRWHNTVRSESLSARPNVTNGSGAKQAKSRCAQIAPHPRTPNQPLDPEVCRRDVSKSQKTRRACFRNDRNQPGRSGACSRKSETVAGARESKGGLSEQLSSAGDSWEGHGFSPATKPPIRPTPRRACPTKSTATIVTAVTA